MPDRYYLNIQSKDDTICFKCKKQMYYTTYSSRELEGPSLDEYCGFPENNDTEEENEQWSKACNKLATKEVRGVIGDDALRWEHVGGYGGSWDMLKRTLVLCPGCTNEVLGEYIRVNHVIYTTPEDFHYARRLERKDSEIKMRWQARKEKMAIKKALDMSNKSSTKRRM